MSHVILCEIRQGALPALKALRLRHLEYVAVKRSEILFGGPARAADGTPETMIIVVATDDRAAAEAFIAAEPYNASGQVFASVTVRPWSQVIPELAEGALESAIAGERVTASTRDLP
jgi:hypothetical protein